MTGAWPWLAVAGMGALHGLNPATGWMFAAAWGVRSGVRGRAWRALLPIAVGHAGSVVLVTALMAFGLGAQRSLLQVVAGGLGASFAALHLSGRLPRRVRAPTGQAGLALWSLMMSTAHGAGMMLVPALMPLCIAGSPAREITASGSLALALAAVTLHMAAMLAVTGMLAMAACRSLALGGPRLRQWLRRPACVRPPPAAPASRGR
jgi:hypothetical protein